MPSDTHLKFYELRSETWKKISWAFFCKLVDNDPREKEIVDHLFPVILVVDWQRLPMGGQKNPIAGHVTTDGDNMNHKKDLISIDNLVETVYRLSRSKTTGLDKITRENLWLIDGRSLEILIKMFNWCLRKPDFGN